MVENVAGFQKNIRGAKGNILTSQLKNKKLENVMVVPIEIGKSYNKALIANYFGSVFKDSFEFHNSQEGIKFLHKNIIDISKNQQIEQIIVGMEATGHYFKKSASLLNEMGYNNLFILNPFSTACCRKAGLVWSKTDDIDLCAVGQCLIVGYGTPYKSEETMWEDLKETCRCRRFLVKQQTSLKNKLHSYLDILLPGITKLKLFKDNNLWSDASLDFFTKYTHLAAIKQLNQKNILNFFQRRGRRVSFELADQLINWTHGTFQTDSSTNNAKQFLFIELINQLKALSQRINTVEVKLVGYLVQTPAVLLLSIDYIGPLRAAEFAGEIGSLHYYSASRALIKAAGLDSTRRQSSSSESSKHPTSNKGSKRLRYITIQIADALMKHNKHFANIAQDLVSKGKSKDCACIATGARFIRIAFWMMKNQIPFQPPNRLGVSDEPLAKIKTFLQNNNASDLVETYIATANKFFKKGAPIM